jgi:hypothetical protein
VVAAPPPAPPSPPPTFQAPPVWRSLRGLTTALTVLFWAIVGANVLLVFALLNQRAAVEDAIDELLLDLHRVDDADSLVVAAAVLVSLLTVSIAVVFIIWMWRAAKNNEALGRARPRLSAGWAIGGWFIPLANFVLPVLIMQDLWRGSDSSVPRGDPNWRQARGSTLVGLWWGTLLASVIARVAAGSNSDEAGEYSSLTEYRTVNTLLMLGALLAIPAGVLALTVVRGLADRHERCLEAQRRVWQQESISQPPASA